HGPDDPSRGRGALRLRAAGARPARRARRPRPPRTADPPRLRRQELPDPSRRAHPGAAPRGRRSRPGPADSVRVHKGALGAMAEIRVMREDLLPPKEPPRRHLISIRNFERSLERELKKLPTLRGKTVVNLFYESSTRTSSSFELAAKRLSADTMS